MGKRKKEHRKRVAARNQRIKQAETAFKNRFQDELLRHIEMEKQKMAENKEQKEEVNNNEATNLE